MQAQEHTGRESVSSAERPGDSLLRDVDAWLHELLAAGANDDCAFGKMDDDPLARTGLKKFVRGLSGSGEVDFPLTENRNTCRALGFKFVQDAVIAVAQCREDNIRKSVAVFAHEVNARSEAGFLRPMKHGCRHGSVDGVRPVESVKQQEIAQMKDARVAAREVKVRGVEKRVRPPFGEKRFGVQWISLSSRPYKKLALPW